VDLAENGAVAVERFRTGHYDLILMDMHMPVMDGYTATRMIRQWEHEQHVPPTPIIALTAQALPNDVQKSLAGGCTAHLSKPIHKAPLLRTLFEQTKHVPAPARGPSDDHAATWIVHVDPAIVDLLPEFFAGMKQHAVAIRDALARGDYATVGTLGHRLKGDGGTFGFEPISTYGVLLEQAARANNAEAIRQGLADLESYLQGVRVVTN
jgi:CheY-like chemotaxis protein